MAAGLVLFAIGAVGRNTGAFRASRSALWMVPWLGGHVIIGLLGRYGGGRNILPDWVDLITVIAFSLVIFYWGIALSVSPERAAAHVAKDAHQM